VAQQTLVPIQGFLQKIEALSGENVFACYQCGMCSAGCPFAEQMDMLPNQIIRGLQLQDWSVVESNAMWICASCLSCQVRCPKGIDLSRLMEALRQLYLRKHMDRVSIDEMTPDEIRRIPEIALVGSFRKKTG